MPVKNRSALRVARHDRLRRRVSGTTERPRLAVFRSEKHIYAQIIDDTKGHTLAAAGSHETAIPTRGDREGARQVGRLLAQRAKEKGVSSVVFDRGGFQYHGRVAALADGAREEGLEF